MRTLLMVGLALLLGTMAMGYIFQRDRSVQLIRVQEEQATRRCVLVDARDSLRVEIARRADFARMKQLAGAGVGVAARAAVPVEPDSPPIASAEDRQ